VTDFQLLGTWVGLIGGFSGFIAVLLQARALYVNAPRIKLKCTYAITTADAKQFYSMEVRNKGAMPITLNSIGVSFQNKMHSSFNLYDENDRLGASLPFRIESHSAQSWLFGKDATILAIQQLGVKPNFRGYVTLSTGKRKSSKKIRIKLL
jgi:hypothetical protein